MLSSVPNRIVRSRVPSSFWDPDAGGSVIPQPTLAGKWSVYL